MSIEIQSGSSVPLRYARRDRALAPTAADTPSAIVQPANGLVQAVSAQPEPLDAQRVAELRQAIQEGRYHVDHNRLAQAILAHVL